MSLNRFFLIFLFKLRNQLIKRVSIEEILYFFYFIRISRFYYQFVWAYAPLINNGFFRKLFLDFSRCELDSHHVSSNDSYDTQTATWQIYLYSYWDIEILFVMHTHDIIIDVRKVTGRLCKGLVALLAGWLAIYRSIEQ